MRVDRRRYIVRLRYVVRRRVLVGLYWPWRTEGEVSSEPNPIEVLK